HPVRGPVPAGGGVEPRAERARRGAAAAAASGAGRRRRTGTARAAGAGRRLRRRPRRPPAARRWLPGARPPPAGPAVTGPGPRVLIADDQALVRAGFRLILTARGIEVVGEVSDGADAVAAARRLRPDVVLMDIRMPRMDGIEAARRIL